MSNTDKVAEAREPGIWLDGSTIPFDDSEADALIEQAGINWDTEPDRHDLRKLARLVQEKAVAQARLLLTLAHRTLDRCKAMKEFDKEFGELLAEQEPDEFLPVACMEAKHLPRLEALEGGFTATVFCRDEFQDSDIRLFTEQQVEAIRAHVRKQALEEAAKVCEEQGKVSAACSAVSAAFEPNANMAYHLMRQIRALAEEK